MGKQTSGWVKGSFCVFIAGILLMTGVSLNHYIKAKAVSYEPKHPKNTRLITTEKQGEEKVAQMTNGTNPDTELTH